jgi:Glycosyl hydrolase family 9/Cellulase N-terminal ig-like domain
MEKGFVRGIHRALGLSGALLLLTSVLKAQTTFDQIEGIGGAIPAVGATDMRLLTPTLLEISRINTQPSGGSPDSWSFVSSGAFTAPDATTYQVSVDGQPVTATIGGFRRRPLYAPIAKRDLRIDNRIFITLPTPVSEGSQVTLTTSGWETAGSTKTYSTTLSSSRRSPVVHVNQEGYATTYPKQAMVGYYIGSMGELDIPSTTFTVVDDQTGATAFSGNLTLRKDFGYAYTPTPYQKVYMADFSALQTEGVYRLVVPGLGSSLKFRISNDMLLNFARSYAIGLYNQRCGSAVQLPYSRHTHAACHAAVAEIPTPQANYTAAWSFINSMSSGQVSSESAQYYPILKTGTIDVSGGHHDAGDYSKYTINSAQLIHSLVFAVDAFPGVGALDNLGIPESGDGKSDLLQEAKIEADFLAKMQDDDGGFFFLVYPKARKYEDNVLPDKGDTQIVWPKNTASTAAAVGALADIGSSPLFKQQFPVEAALYMQKAQAGWNFLLNAIAAHGKDGSYQKLSHYGDIFGHNDELAWAASAMFVATGDAAIHQKLKEWYDPAYGPTWRWGWWGGFEGYGCASRDYAFAVVSGKRQASEMDAAYLTKTQGEVTAFGKEIRVRAQQGAYGSPLDVSSKRQNVAGWFFNTDRTFDVATANIISPDAGDVPAIIGGMNCEWGCNPLNLSYITGSGQRQQREIVHQYAQNDDRIMPPSGIPIGTIQGGFTWNAVYTSELGGLTFPGDGFSTAKYPFYDRWADTYNTSTEFVVANQARSLACAAAMAGRAGLASQAWQTPSASITLPADYVVAEQPLTVEITSPGLDFSTARVTWEVGDQEPVIGTKTYTFTPHNVTRQWIEAEAVFPDGRRVCAAGVFGVKAPQGAQPFALTDDTIALYHFDTNYQDSGPNNFHLTALGNVSLVDMASGWMDSPSGKAVRFNDMGDNLTVTIPDSFLAPGNTVTPLAIEFWICPLAWKARGKGNGPIISLEQYWDMALGVTQDMWSNPACPMVKSNYGDIASFQQFYNAVQMNTWQKMKVSRDSTGTLAFYVNDQLISSCVPTKYPTHGNDWKLQIGNFKGYIDEVRITGMPNHGVSTGTSGSTSGSSSSSSSSSSTAPATATVTSPFNTSYASDSQTVALYHFDGDYKDSGPNGFHLTAFGNTTRVPSYSSSGRSMGEALRTRGASDYLTVTIPDSYVMPTNVATELTMEAWMFVRYYVGYGTGTAMLKLYQNWDCSVQIYQDKWANPTYPVCLNGSNWLVPNSEWNSLVKTGVWQHIRITRDTSGNASFWVNGVCLKTMSAPMAYGRTIDWSFMLGGMDADFDEVRISRTVRALPPADNFTADANTVALYHFDQDYSDASGNAYTLTGQGNIALTNTNLEWMSWPSGKVLRLSNIGDKLTVPIPNAALMPNQVCSPMTIEARIFPRAYKAYDVGNYPLLSLRQSDTSTLEVIQNVDSLEDAPQAASGIEPIVTASVWQSYVTLNTWHKIKLTRDAAGVCKLWVDGTCISTATTTPDCSLTSDWALTIGNMDADVDEVRVSNIVR